MGDVLSELLKERSYILTDGATGTNLFAAGLESGYPPELWNIEPANVEKVYNLNRAFVDAGADLILTNSFGGTAPRLKLHQAESRVGEVNAAAARIARRAVDGAGRSVVVAGSVGPTGELFEPLGPMTHEVGIAAFVAQAEGLKAGGADVLWIETMFSVEELNAAIKAAEAVGLPYVCTLSFDTKGRTMMGVSPAQVAQMMKAASPRPIAYGANCGTGASELVAVLLHMKEASDPQDVLVAKSNCGIPKLEGAEIRYTGTPELMSDYVRLSLAAGARIVGGCCGTTPGHIKAMRAAMDAYVPTERPSLEQIVSQLGEVSAGAQKQLRHAADNAERPARTSRRAPIPSKIDAS
jgi:5-methyltetrahydrofolate--homocysteine methyltransferase